MNASPLQAWLQLLEDQADEIALGESWAEVRPSALLLELAQFVRRDAAEELARLDARLWGGTARRFLEYLYLRSPRYAGRGRLEPADAERIFSTLAGAVSAARCLVAARIGGPVPISELLGQAASAWTGSEQASRAGVFDTPSAPRGSAWLSDALQAATGLLGREAGLGGLRLWCEELDAALRPEYSPGESGREVYRAEVAVLAEGESGQGSVANLTVAVLGQGSGELFAHPLHMGLTPADGPFRSAARAVQAVLARHGDAERLSGHDLAWHLDLGPGADAWSVLHGGSHGAALASASLQALAGKQVDPEFAVTATVSADGALGRVEGVAAKVTAALARLDAEGRPRFRRFFVHPDNLAEARRAIDQAGMAGQASADGVHRIESLLPELSGHRDELGQLLVRQVQSILADAGQRIQRPFGSLREFAAVQVPLSISATVQESGQARDADGEIPLLAEAVNCQWEQVRDQLRRALIVAGPGTGKTMLLWQEVARRCEEGWRDLRSTATSQPRFSVYLTASEVVAAEPWPDLIAAACRAVAQRHQLRPRFEEYVAESVRGGACLLTIDGLDEAGPDDQAILADRLDQLVQHHPDCRVLMATRREAMLREHWSALPVQVELLPFEQREQVEQATRAWFYDAPQLGERLLALLRLDRSESRSLRELLKLPLLHRIACTVLRRSLESGGEIQAVFRRTALYESFFASLLTQWSGRPPRPNFGQLELILHLAGDACLDYWRSGAAGGSAGAPPADGAQRAGRSGTRSRLVRCILQAQAAYPQFASRPLLEDLCAIGLLVAERSPRGVEYSFAHQTFAEYLVGLRLATLANERGWNSVAEEVDLVADLPEWQEVLVFTAGLLEDPVPMLRMLADPNKDDVLRHRLALAARCLGEVI